MAETEQIDTPQVEEPRSVDVQDESSLVDDVIFGGEQGSVSEAFDEVEQGIAQAEPVKEPQEEPSVNVQPQGENDEVRYQYWQSQADKLKNERDQLQAQFNSLATQQAPQPQQQVEEAEPEIELPAPPEKPQRPYNFTMDEAMTDPQSESAKFVQQEQSWRDEMDEYKNLQFEYQMAMMQDERDKLQQERQTDIQRREAEQAQAQQMQNIQSQVMNQFKVDSTTAEDFVRVMSDPDSISLDNLWKLYSSDKGIPSPQPSGTPSAEFQQVQRAQQVPTSMGVMPSQNRQNEGSVEDKIIDSMIGDYNKQNPFN
tara:strand:+ start:2478 stop:3413 length:936 start_codon:yes stop_codon:yes gene_type:complete